MPEGGKKKPFIYELLCTSTLKHFIYIVPLNKDIHLYIHNLIIKIGNKVLITVIQILFNFLIFVNCLNVFCRKRVFFFLVYLTQDHALHLVFVSPKSTAVPCLPLCFPTLVLFKNIGHLFLKFLSVCFFLFPCDSAYMCWHCLSEMYLPWGITSGDN